MVAENIAELIDGMQNVMRSLGPCPDPCKVAAWLRAQLGSNIQVGVEPIESTVYELPAARGTPILPRSRPDPKARNDLAKRFECLRDAAGGLISLYADRSLPDHNRLLYRQAKGIVIEYPSWCVLAISPPNMSVDVSLQTLQKHSSEYAVFNVHDGTTVTVYRHGDTIRMATRRCPDISNITWLGNITYRDAFDEVAQQYTDFNIENLSYEHSYSIGFRHQALHPLLKDPPRMWLIQQTDLTNMRTTYNNDIGLPVQEHVKTTLNDIKSICHSALEDYITRGVINYGFILRGNCGNRSNVLIESSLYVAIRKMMYDFPDTRQGPMPFTSADQRLVYVTLRAYLTIGWYSKFNKLYPQYQVYFDEYDKLMNEMKRRITTELRTTKSTFVPGDELGEVVAALVVAMRKENINVSSKDASSIIRDYVRNPAHMQIYLPICCARITMDTYNAGRFSASLAATAVSTDATPNDIGETSVGVSERVSAAATSNSITDI